MKYSIFGVLVRIHEKASLSTCPSICRLRRLQILFVTLIYQWPAYCSSTGLICAGDCHTEEEHLRSDYNIGFEFVSLVFNIVKELLELRLI